MTTCNMQIMAPNRTMENQVVRVVVQQPVPSLMPMLNQLGFATCPDQVCLNAVSREWNAKGTREEMAPRIAELTAVREALAPYFGGNASLTRADYTEVR